MSWNVTWLVDPNDLSYCVERDWFYEIMSRTPISSIAASGEANPPQLAHAIICASCPNHISEADLIGYLQRLPKPRVLYHMSDEYVAIGRNVYQHCDLVIRNGSANFAMFGDPKIIQVPLGYVTGLGNSRRISSNSSDRRSSFAFLGTVKNDRNEMLDALQTLPGPFFVRKMASFAESAKSFNNATIAVYKNSIFVPDPKGNWNPECFRLYDALEWGCVPLIRRYLDTDYHVNYHDRVFGGHPIPTFDDWKEAAEFARIMLSDRAGLDTLQSKIFTWWQNYKIELATNIAHKLSRLAI